LKRKFKHPKEVRDFLAKKQREYRARKKAKTKLVEAKSLDTKTSTSYSTSGVKQYERLQAKT